MAKYVTRGAVAAASTPPASAPSVSDALSAMRTRPTTDSKRSLDPVSSSTVS